MMRLLRNTCLYAYWQGFFEHLGGEQEGRTHAENQDWNEAYDRGWNLAVRVIGE